MGDFNDLLHAPNKKGKNVHPQYLMDGFRRVIEDCNLTKINLEGGQYPEKKKVRIHRIGLESALTEILQVRLGGTNFLCVS